MKAIDECWVMNLNLMNSANRFRSACMKFLRFAKMRTTNLTEKSSNRNSVAIEKKSDITVQNNESSNFLLIEQSGMLDAEFYLKQRKLKFSGREAIRDYLSVGESQGFMPSRYFDPVYYRAQNPDVVASGMNLFLHYVMHGAREGRAGTPFPGILKELEKAIDPDRESIVLVVHETSRSGAPILGWNIVAELKREFQYNVVVISLQGGGQIERAFRSEANLLISPIGDNRMSQADIDWICRILKITINPKYAIANSAATFSIAVALSRLKIDVISLVHEFSSVFGSELILAELFSESRAIVFPAKIVRDSAVALYPSLPLERTIILPQGRSLVPASLAEPSAKVSNALATSSDILNWATTKSCFTIVGMGTVEWRKGVDLFVSAAVSFLSRFPGVSCRFVWIGAQTAHVQRQEMMMFLREQLARSQVADAVILLPETSDINRIYDCADALFVSSRLDPLPNVAIDALSLGIPVVSFDRATGVAELLQDDSELSALVVPYADAYAAATILHKLATNLEWYQAVCSRAQSLALDLFNMNRYVIALNEIGKTFIKETEIT